jgi:hypothetical protein
MRPDRRAERERRDAAVILRALLVEIDEGRIEATAPEVAYLVGVVDTLDAIVGGAPPATA